MKRRSFLVALVSALAWTAGATDARARVPDRSPRQGGDEEQGNGTVLGRSLIDGSAGARRSRYAHISDADLITPARKSYAGPLEAGEDLMTVEIGETVFVRRKNR